MRLILYVHDLRPEVGHSNSLIELVRHLPPSVLARFSTLEVVAYTCAPLDELFPDFKGRTKFTRVPFAGIRPVLLKAIFYEFWCALLRWFGGGPALRIGVGISYGGVDAVSIQFIHHQWTEAGIRIERAWSLRRLYKRALFAYFEARERALFRRPGVKFFAPAEFLCRHLLKHDPGMQTKTIYSGVDLARFKLDSRGKREILLDLQVRYPTLAGLDPSAPIYLFVGAYERKGLPAALELLCRHVANPQLVVVGAPSAGLGPEWPAQVRVHRVAYTREVPAFYALADVFIFPTAYEPFGLVLFEAMAMGLTVITRRADVGASELLEGLPEVFFCDRPDFRFPESRSKTVQEKLALREARVAQLGDVSWAKAGLELGSFL